MSYKPIPALSGDNADFIGDITASGNISMGGNVVLTGISSGDITGALGYTPLSSETDDQTLDEVLTQGNVSASGITVGSSTISGAGTSTFTVDSTNSFGRSLTLSTNGISPAISAENELTIKTSNNDTEIKLEGGGSTDNIQFIANEVEQVRITTAGVGIGTTSPDAALHVDDGDAIIGRVGAGSPNSTLTVAGYDDFGLDFKAHNTWTHWKARVGHGKNFELYNDGATNDGQTLQLGKTNATENASLLLYSTGVFMGVGRNTGLRIASFGVDAVDSYRGDLYLDIRSSTTVTDRFEFNRGGEFIASGIGVGYTSPSYELDVNGTGHFAYDLYVDADLDVTGDITMAGNTVLTGITSGDITGALGYTPLSSETDDQTLDEVLTQGNVSASGITVGSSTISGDLDVSGALTVTNDDTGVSDIFSVDGVNGRLFGVTDEVTGTVFSVNDAAGLPIVEVESTSTYDKITIGEYGSDALVISGTNSAIFNVDVDITGDLDVTGDITMAGNTVLTGITSGDITGALGYTPLSSETDDQTLDEVLAQGNTSTRDMSVGDISGTSLDITTDVTVTGDVEADEFIGDLRGAVSFRAKAGEALSAGDVVYISGIDGNTTVVAKADADDSDKMPAFGVSKETVSVNANVRVVNFGSIGSLDTSAYSEGDELFVSDVAGQLTGIAPTGEFSALQKMAKVTRSHGSSGSITVMGAGRTNAVPNLNEGRLFVGDSSNQAVADGTIHVDIANSKVGIGTTSPVDTLDIKDSNPRVRLIDTTVANDPAAYMWNSEGSLLFRADVTQARANTYIRFDIDQSEKLRITDGGNVGIGTTSPSQKLHLDGGIARFSNAASNWIEIDGSVSGNNTARISSRFNRFEIKTNTGAGDPHISFIPASGGYVGINDTAPSYPLVVNHSAYNENNYVEINSANGNNAGVLLRDPGGIRGLVLANPDNDLVFMANGASEKMRIEAGGNVGIGTTSPSYELDVSGSGHFVNNLIVDGDITMAGATVLTGISSSSVTDALGYTPVDPSATGTFINQNDTGAFAAANHTHALANSTSAGFMSDSDFDKLGAIEDGADVTPSWVPDTDPNYITGINSSDVTNALGYTPVDPSTTGSLVNDNDIANFITGISSSDVTDALGYTPLSSETDDQTLDEVLAQGNTSTLNMSVGEITGSNLTLDNDSNIYANGSGFLRLGNTDGGKIYISGNAAQSVISPVSNDLYIQTQRDGDDIIFKGGASVTEIMRLDADTQRVGIGTTSPNSTLQVYGNARFGASPSANVTAGSSGLTLNAGANQINFTNANAEISSAGYLSIDIDQNNNQTDEYFAITQNNKANELFRITADGNVGIGTTSPSYELDVSGSGHFVNNLVVDGDITMGGATVLTGISSSSVTDALGYTPVDPSATGALVNDNDIANFITGISSSDVTDALGYTPLESESQTLSSVLANGNTSSHGISVNQITGTALTIDTDTLFVDASTNRVGIGTTGVGHPLVVQGASASSDTNIQLTDSSSDERLTFGYDSDGAFIYGGNNGVGTSELHIRATNNSPIRIGAHNGSVMLEPGSYDGINRYEFRPGEIHSYVRKSDNTQQKASVIHHDVYDETNNYTSISLATLAGNTESVGLLVKRYSDGNRVGIGVSSFNNSVGFAVDRLYNSFEHGSDHITIRPDGKIYTNNSIDIFAQSYTNRGSTSGDVKKITFETTTGSVLANLFEVSTTDTAGGSQYGFRAHYTTAESEKAFRAEFDAFGNNSNYYYHASAAGVEKFSVDQSGDGYFAGDLIVDAGLDVTGDITMGGATVLTGISSSSVTDALGYTPVNPSTTGALVNDNDIANFITGISSSDVTDALGYTPLESESQTLSSVLANGNTSSYGISVNQITGTALTIDTDTLFVDATNDRVGIGTTSPSAKLHIDDNASSGTGIKVTGGGGGQPLGIFTRDVNGTGTININSSDSRPQIKFESSSNTFSLGVNGSAFEIADNTKLGTNARLSITDTGNVGIGTTTPSDKLDVYGNIKLVQTQNYIKFANDLVTIKRDGSNFLLFNSYEGFKFYDTQDSVERMRIDGDGNVGIGTASPDYELHVIGTASFTDTVAGAYFEENASHESLKSMRTGFILVMDKDGELVPCTKENDTTVFGVAKKGYKQPIIMGAEPIKVTGPIKVGDFITTSNVEGHGMKAENPQFGTIIAQAMESGDGESYNIKAMIRKM